jgi:hypothetical protein
MTVNKEDSKKSNEEGIFKITQYVLDQNYKNDLAIMVASMKSPPSQNKLFKKLNFAKKDPSNHNVIPVVTYFDQYPALVKKNADEGRMLLKKWETSFRGQLPYFVALHQLEPDKAYGNDLKSQFENKASNIAFQLDSKDKENVSCIEGPLPEYAKQLDYFKISALKADIEKRRNAVFQQNATKIIGRLEGRLEKLKELIEAKRAELNDAKGNTIDSILTDLSDLYVTAFQSLYTGLPFRGSLDVKEKFEFDWEMEKMNFGNLFSWPGEPGTPVMRDPSICYRNTINESVISACTYMSNMMTATGMQRMNRLKSYLGLKVTSIELTDPSEGFVNAHLAETAGITGIINPENAVRNYESQ